MRAIRAVPLPLLLAACAAGDAAERTLVRDSAGIAIVENSADAVAMAPVWTLGAAPELVIGVVEGDPAYQLHRVSAGAMLPDGRIVIANGGTSELRFYDASGRHLYSAGGDGEGPGEFRSTSALAMLPGDSILVWDGRLQRISIFDDQGTFARSFPLERAVLNPEFLGAFDDGSIAMIDFRLDVPQSGFGMSNSTIVRYGSHGAFVDSLGTFPWYEIGLIDRDNGLIGRRTFSPRTSAALVQDRFWIGTAVEPSVDVYGRDAALMRIIRWQEEDRTVRPEDTRRYLDERFADAPPEQRRMFEELPVHDRFPAYEQVGADRNGNVWVKAYRRPGQEGPDAWFVFDQDGVLKGRIDLPERLRVLETGEDGRVLAVEPDELDVERVVVYRLQRTDAS